MKTFSLILLLNFLSAMTNSKFYNDSWAVIIGINKYQNIKGLNYAVDDAQDIHDMLITKFHFRETNIALLLDENATYQNIRSSLYEIAEKVGENDRLIIFFAGHGTQKKLPSGGDKGFIIPVDGDPSKLFLTAIDMNEFKNISDITSAKHVLYLMDSCFGGLMATGSRSLDRKIPGYMSKITRDKGRQIITAGGKDEESQERPEWGNSAFTKNLLRGLQDEMADENDDGYITANELGNYLKIKVTEDSDNAQTPQIQRYGTGEGEFVFEMSQINKGENIDKIESGGNNIDYAKLAVEMVKKMKGEEISEVDPIKTKIVKPGSIGISSLYPDQEFLVEDVFLRRSGLAYRGRYALLLGDSSEKTWSRVVTIPVSDIQDIKGISETGYYIYSTGRIE